jgi:hypothetical protein
MKELIIDALNSSDLDENYKGLSLAIDLQEILSIEIKSLLKRKPDIILADRINQWMELPYQNLLKSFEFVENEAIIFIYALLLFPTRNPQVLDRLKRFAEEDNQEYSIMATNKLLEINYKGMYPILKKKLLKADMNEVDYILHLMDGIKRIEKSLPILFVKKLSPNIDWRIKLILEKDFNIVI